MKCHKCSYVSFDYLSECLKCHVSLEDARSALGFTSLRPAVPSLLGALLSDQNLNQSSRSAGAEAPGASDEFSSIDIGEGFELFGDDEGHEETGAGDNTSEHAGESGLEKQGAASANLSDVAAEPSIFLDDSDDFSLSLSFDDMESDLGAKNAPLNPDTAKTTVRAMDAPLETDEEDLFEEFELEDAFSEETVHFDPSQDGPPETAGGKSSATQPGRSSGKQGGEAGRASYVSKPSPGGVVIKSAAASEEFDLPELSLEDLDLEGLSLDSDEPEASTPANGQEKNGKRAGFGAPKKGQPPRRGAS